MLRKHAKSKDTRTDFLHKLSTNIIRDNQMIVLEDLNVSGMIKNRKLSRAISETQLKTIPDTFRMDLLNNKVVILD